MYRRRSGSEFKECAGSVRYLVALCKVPDRVFLVFRTATGGLDRPSIRDCARGRETALVWMVCNLCNLCRLRNWLFAWLATAAISEKGWAADRLGENHRYLGLFGEYRDPCAASAHTWTYLINERHRLSNAAGRGLSESARLEMRSAASTGIMVIDFDLLSPLAKRDYTYMYSATRHAIIKSCLRDYGLPSLDSRLQAS